MATQPDDSVDLEMGQKKAAPGTAGAHRACISSSLLNGTQSSPRVSTQSTPTSRVWNILSLQSLPAPGIMRLFHFSANKLGRE